MALEALFLVKRGFDHDVPHVCETFTAHFNFARRAFFGDEPIAGCRFQCMKPVAEHFWA